MCRAHPEAFRRVGAWLQPIPEVSGRVSPEGFGPRHHVGHFDDGLLLYGLFTRRSARGTEARDDLCREFLVRGIRVKRTSNKPAAGKAGIARQLTIDHHW